MVLFSLRVWLCLFFLCVRAVVFYYFVCFYCFGLSVSGCVYVRFCQYCCFCFLSVCLMFCYCVVLICVFVFWCGLVSCVGFVLACCSVGSCCLFVGVCYVCVSLLVRSFVFVASWFGLGWFVLDVWCVISLCLFGLLFVCCESEGFH